jgi:hypothetical protein
MAQAMPADDEMKRVMEVQQRYEHYLLGKPHVVGIGVGFAAEGGQPTPQVALVVMVDRKLPPQEVPPMDRIPSQLDGVRVDVQETGGFEAFNSAVAQ